MCLNPLTNSTPSLRSCDHIIHYCITTDLSSPNKTDPVSTTVNIVSAIWNGGNTTKGFAFNPEMVSHSHCLRQDLIVPKIMDYSSELWHGYHQFVSITSLVFFCVPLYCFTYRVSPFRGLDLIAVPLC